MQTQAASYSYTMVLVQRDANVRGADGKPKLLNIVGRVIRSDDGFRFHPNNASHKPGKVGHPSAIKAIPAWADKLAHKHGFGDLLTWDEYREAMRLPVEA